MKGRERRRPICSTVLSATQTSKSFSSGSVSRPILRTNSASPSRSPQPSVALRNAADCSTGNAQPYQSIHVSRSCWRTAWNGPASSAAYSWCSPYVGEGSRDQSDENHEPEHGATFPMRFRFQLDMAAARASSAPTASLGRSISSTEPMVMVGIVPSLAWTCIRSADCSSRP